MSILKDDSPMPNGKYKGTAMANVPAHHLIWCYENGFIRSDVKSYVLENIEVLRAEVNKNKS